MIFLLHRVIITWYFFDLLDLAQAWTYHFNCGPIAQHVTVGVEGAFQIAREAARGLVGVPPGGTINLSTGNGAIRMSLFYIGAQADTTQANLQRLEPISFYQDSSLGGGPIVQPDVAVVCGFEGIQENNGYATIEILSSRYAIKIGDAYKHCKSGLFPEIGFVASSAAPHLDFIFLCPWYIRTLNGVLAGQYLDVASAFTKLNPARMSSAVRQRLGTSGRTEVDLMRPFDQSLLYLLLRTSRPKTSVGLYKDDYRCRWRIWATSKKPYPTYEHPCVTALAAIATWISTQLYSDDDPPSRYIVEHDGSVKRIPLGANWVPGNAP